MQVIPQTEFSVPEAEETGLTFVENAILKARNAARHTGLPAIADDSGIEVDALNGAPGIYSARFSGEGATDARNNALLVEKLRDVPESERTARYRAVIVMMRHADDPTPLITQGSWEGRIVLDPRGEGGFGYDPHFFCRNWVRLRQSCLHPRSMPRAIGARRSRVSSTCSDIKQVKTETGTNPTRSET